MKNLTKAMCVALGVLASGCATKPLILKPMNAPVTKEAYDDDNFRNIFRAARNCDRPAYENFVSKHEGGYYGRGIDVELDVKSRLLLCSRELEWMYRERTPEEQALVERGIKELRTRNKNDDYEQIRLCELLAKDHPEEALGIADKLIADSLRWRSSTPIIESGMVYPTDSIGDVAARALLDKAFILIQTERDYETARKTCRTLKATHYLADYLKETMSILEEYLAVR